MDYSEKTQVSPYFLVLNAMERTLATIMQLLLKSFIVLSSRSKKEEF